MTPADEWARGNQQEREEDRRAEEQDQIEAEDAAHVLGAPQTFVVCVCRNGQHESAD